MLDAQAEPPLAENPSCQKAEENGRRLRDGVLKAMDAAKVEALVYPSWNNPPRLIGDLNTPHGNNSPLLSPHWLSGTHCADGVCARDTPSRSAVLGQGME